MTSTTFTLRTRRLSNALGAEIIGLDLSRPLAGDVLREVRAIWVQYGVVLFRGQQALTPAQHIEFSQCFGEVDRNDNAPTYRMPGYPELVEVTNRDIGGKPSLTRNLGRSWHSDLEYTLRPALATLLWCEQVPDVGGDTQFAHMGNAWDAVSPGMQKMLRGLEAEYDIKLGVRPKEADGSFDEIHGHNVSVAQPLVREHPESGRTSLFASDRIDRFVGWTRDESMPLLHYLMKVATHPENVLRHRWQPGDLVMWDNRCVIHQALADYDRSQVRYMRRSAVMGEPSGYTVRGDASVLARETDAH